MAIPSGAPPSILSEADRSETVFTLCRESSLAPGRAARRWMSVTSRGRSVPAEKIAERLRINPEFAQKVYDIIQPGTTVIITDQPIVRSRGNAAILEG